MKFNGRRQRGSADGVYIIFITATVKFVDTEQHQRDDCDVFIKREE